MFSGATPNIAKLIYKSYIILLTMNVNSVKQKNKNKLTERLLCQS